MEGFDSIGGFWDPQTISFEIPWFLVLLAKIYIFFWNCTHICLSQYLPPKRGKCQTDKLLLELDLQESCQQLIG